MQADNADVQFVADMSKAVAQPVTVEPVHYAIVPEGHKLESLLNFQFSERPQRKKGSAALFDAESFCGYFSRFKDANSIIFVDQDAMSFRGVLNYHEEENGAPRHGDFECSFKLRETEPWKRWKAGHEKPKNQVDFARFIEDNLADIYAPPAAAMLELSRDLQVHSEAEFQSANKLSNGQTKLVYSEQIKATIGQGTQEVPDKFTIRLAIFHGQAVRDIELRLRLRLSGGKLSMWWEIPRLEEILLSEMDSAASKIKDACGAPMFYGKP